MNNNQMSNKFNSVNWDDLGFGRYFSDNIYQSDFDGDTWDEGKIIPYGPMEIEPANCTLHYGQTIFEGLKAFKRVDGKITIFRPDKNAQRIANSAERLCMAPFPKDRFIDALEQIVKKEAQWVPDKPNTSLYLRPLQFGTGNFLGVHSSKIFRFLIICSPVGSYYKEGMNPVRILVSSDYVRAVRGGLGMAKTAANYAASLYASESAKKQGYSQVLWLDGVSLNFVDEVGAMNIMFVIDDEIITPPLSQGTLLPGVTRDTVIQLAKEQGLKVSERPISITEVYEAHHSGKLNEIFGTGTAATISPVGSLTYKGEEISINQGKIGKYAQLFFDKISGIQRGTIEDKYNWCHVL